MRKTKKEEQVIVVEKTVDVICNKCGKSCYPASSELYDPEGLIEVEVPGGYGSKVIGDLTTWRFSVCEDCLGKFVKTFKIPVDVKDHELHDFIPAPKAKEIYEKAYKKNITEQLLYFINDKNLEIKDLKNKIKQKTAKEIHKYLETLKKKYN